MHLPILKRCGWVLLALFALDVGFLVWSIVQSHSYNLNLLALVGGILLLRGGLKTARWVALLTTFGLAVGLVGLALILFVFPLGYWLALLRSGPGVWLAVVAAVIHLGAMIWVRRQVLRPEVRDAQVAAGIAVPRTALAAGLGVVFPVLMVSLVTWALRTDAAKEAARRAEQELGGNYRYVVTRLAVSSQASKKEVSATVAAYNDRELKIVPVKWEE